MITTSFERSNSYVFGARSSKLWLKFEGIDTSIERHILYFINGRLFGNERYAVYPPKQKDIDDLCRSVYVLEC